MSKRKIQPDTPDADNPEWGDADFSRARPALEVLPELFSQPLIEKFVTPRTAPKQGGLKPQTTPAASS